MITMTLGSKKQQIIIFSDVDGTLYGNDNTMLSATAQTIAWAQSLGVEFIIATGNPYFGQMRNLATKLKLNYIIASGGAEIIDVATSERLLTCDIPQTKITTLVRHAVSVGLGGDWWDAKHIYFNDANSQERLRFWHQREPELRAITKNDVIGPAVKIEFYGDNNTDKVKIDALQKTAITLDLQIARMSDLHVEITASNVSKGHAIEWLINHRAIPRANTMGIGDSANDATMFATVGHSYAMANAPIAIRKLTHHHTSAVDQDGLGEAIHDFLFRMGFRE